MPESTRGTQGALDGHSRPWWHVPEASAVVAGSVGTVLLLLPLLLLASNGLSLVGLTEESTGYRYFYSLRILYTPDERPWIPQGQLVGLVHIGVQLLLTALGYAPTQLQPRIDLFAYIAAALPHLATGAALTWAVLGLRSLGARLAVAAGLFTVALDLSLTSGYHLLLPDYASWIHTLTMISLGCCLRLSVAGAQIGWRWTLGLGLFTGACLGVKVTVVTLAAAPVLLLLLASQSSWTRRMIDCATIGLIGGLVFLLTIWAFYVEALRQLFATSPF
jgi:hypothetical protein